LLFDLTNSSPGNIGRSQEAAKEFVASQLGERDHVAVATYSVDQGFRLVTAFTSHRETLVAAVETLGHPSYFRVADPLFMSVHQPDASRAVGMAGGTADEVMKDVAEDFNRSTNQMNDSYLRARLLAQLEGFAAVARLLDGLRGQKQIILLSEGFDASLIHGRETTGQASRADRAAIEKGEIWKVDSDEIFGNVTASTDLSDMARIFRRSDVVLHAIDVKGLRADVDAREGHQRDSNEALFLLADPTGGSVFKNTNDLAAAFDQMLEEQQVIYVLGFSRQTTEPGKFHELDVKVADVPRGTRVRHREGYYEASEEHDISRVLTTAEVMLSPAPRDDLELDLLAAAFPHEGRAQVPVVLEIDGENLVRGVAGETATAMLYVYAFNPENKVEDFAYERISLDLSQVREKLARSGIRYYGTLALRPGTYDVRVVVRVDETDNIGSKSASITVPEAGSAAVLPPFLFADAGDWIMIREAAAAGEPPYPFVVGAESFVPAPVGEVSADGSYRVALFTYGIAPEQLQLGAKVSGEAGVKPAAVKLVGRSPVAEDGSMQLLFDFTPVDLASGEWNLEFTLTPGDGIARTVKMPFVVR
ncbi:MAG: VWA domain-containing protein, partial [Thermoanaerobaculia bacterium]